MMDLSTANGGGVFLAEDQEGIGCDQVARFKGNGREQAATVKGRLANLNG